MVSTGIAAAGIAAARVAPGTAGTRVMSTATAEVAAGGCVRTPTTPTDVPAATTTVAATTTATVLCQHRGCAHQYRPQNAGCQKKASALGTHNCRLPLPVAPGATILKPIFIRPNLYNAVQAVRCTGITPLRHENHYVNYT
jgi:hypothetical protein